MIHPDSIPSGTDSSSRAFWGQILFVSMALVMLVFFRQHPSVKTLSITFVSIVLEALPFMLIGALAGGFIEVFISQETITRFLPDRRLITFFMAAGLGIIFPVCECAIVPVVRRLLHKGLPLGAAVAFLLSGPIVNPIVAASTAVAYSFRWQMVIERLLYGYLIAVTAGFVLDHFFTKKDALLSTIDPGNYHDGPHDSVAFGSIHDHSNTTSLSVVARLGNALRHSLEDFIDVTRFLVIGAFIAGVLQTLVARQAVASVIGNPAVSILLMMILAFLLSLCSEADAFVAASFNSTLMPVSAQLAFMVLGPMLDIKLLFMYTRVFRKRFIMALAGLTSLLVFLVMALKEMII